MLHLLAGRRGHCPRRAAGEQRWRFGREYTGGLLNYNEERLSYEMIKKRSARRRKVDASS
jgi:hypothetical protein